MIVNDFVRFVLKISTRSNEAMFSIQQININMLFVLEYLLLELRMDGSRKSTHAFISIKFLKHVHKNVKNLND